MRIVVDWDACICSGMCTSAAPALFELDDAGELQLPLGEVVEGSHAEELNEAAAVCPVEAITVEAA